MEKGPKNRILVWGRHPPTHPPVKTPEKKKHFDGNDMSVMASVAGQSGFGKAEMLSVCKIVQQFVSFFSSSESFKRLQMKNFGVEYFSRMFFMHFILIQMNSHLPNHKETTGKTLCWEELCNRHCIALNYIAMYYTCNAIH